MRKWSVALLGCLGLAILYLTVSNDNGTVVIVQTATSPQSVPDIPSEVDSASIPMTAALKPWGYNADRNVARWHVMYKSISKDFAIHKGKFILTDYGADQGYFSVSTAFAFPRSEVIPIELGGAGGALWDEKIDALANMQAQIKKNNVVGRVHICNARFNVTSFHNLVHAGLVVDYQLVLSVIHWFDFGTRLDFEKGLIYVLRAAKVTFLEFPYVGPDQKAMHGQIHFKNFFRWLDNRTDLQDLVLDAVANEEANTERISVKITKLADLKWFHHTRPLYRIDRVDNSAEPTNFRCHQSIKALMCSKTLDSSC